MQHHTFDVNRWVGRQIRDMMKEEDVEQAEKLLAEVVVLPPGSAGIMSAASSPEEHQATYESVKAALDSLLNVDSYYGDR